MASVRCTPPLISRKTIGVIGCVVVAPAPGSTPTQEDVLAICRARLAKFKVPKRVVFRDTDHLPKTPTRKLQNYKLRRAAATP